MANARRNLGLALGLALGMALLPGGLFAGAAGDLPPAMSAVPAGQSAGAAKADVKATPSVKIDNFSFSPASLSVAVGTTVTWVNRDDIPHTVVSTDKVFKSKVLDTDETFTYTFSQAGTFRYFCSLHPKMTGQVIVQSR